MIWLKALILAETFLPAAGLHWAYLETFAQRVTRTEIVLAGLPVEFDGYRIILLSCIHTSGYGPRELLLRQRLRNLDADLLIMAGDFHKVGSSLAATARATARTFEGLRYPDGMIATRGNHDFGGVLESARAAGFRVLFHECHAVRRPRATDPVGSAARPGESVYGRSPAEPAATLTFVGVDAARRRDPDWVAALRRAEPGGFLIGICHSPDGAVSATRHPIRLLLCGHTHGGQICLPGIGPLLTETRLVGTELCAGLCRHGNLPVYVNRGIGWTAFPLRLGSGPEISLLVLRRAR